LRDGAHPRQKQHANESSTNSSFCHGA
jgi:hypothetical protein